MGLHDTFLNLKLIEIFIYLAIKENEGMWTEENCAWDCIVHLLSHKAYSCFFSLSKFVNFCQYSNHFYYSLLLASPRSLVKPSLYAPLPCKHIVYLPWELCKSQVASIHHRNNGLLFFGPNLVSSELFYLLVSRW